MTTIVDVRREQGIAVLTVDNPPVNALSHAVRLALIEALDDAETDDAIEAVVIACRGRTFIAGADITEFDRPPQAPTTGQLTTRIAAMSKPVAAAMHGTVLGGGLEVSLACMVRVLARGATLGLPEIKLGLIPGGGGTVRLPRLVGADRALELIASGRSVGAPEALELNLVHEVVDGPAEAQTVAFLRARMHSLPLRVERLPAPTLDDAFEARAAALMRKAGGNVAVLRVCESVRNASTLSFEHALEAERAIFAELRSSPQSQAQRHLFFAERRTAQLGDIDLRAVAPRPVRQVGVVGAGTLGSGIALSFANAGYDVIVREVSADALAAGMARIEGLYAAALRAGTLAESDVAARIARVKGTTTLADFAGCDLVVEAAFEDITVKQAVFAELDAVLRRGAILASNTSYLDINVLAAATSRPADVAGMHFFSPAHVMKLVEVVRARGTATDVVATLWSVARAMNKVPVVVSVCHGFVGNRMLGARNAQIPRLLLEGALPQDIDEAYRGFGWPMGPLEMWDMAGLDIAWRNRKFLGTSEPVADSLCERGWYGQKTGRGYYRYEAGSRAPQPDHDVTELIEALSQNAGVKRRHLSHAEILERTHLPMINEGWRILDEQIVPRASAIDVIWANGYGFPRWLGGPMHWAEQQGWDTILDGLARWHERGGAPQLEPAAGLVAAAKQHAGTAA